MTPSILVTGGAGLVGNAVLKELNSQGITDILVVDKLGTSPTKWRNLSECQFAEYIEYDDFVANDHYHARHLMHGIKTIAHLGARSHTTEQDMAFLTRNNVQFSRRLAIWAHENRARFVYASSAATYGSGAMEDKDDLEHLYSLRPLNPYGYSKALFDVWMARQGFLSGGNGAVGLKYFNVFGGPTERHKGEQRSLLVKAYDSLAAGRPIELFESANPAIATADIRRDFLSAEDAAKVTVWAALHDKGRQAAGLFNVGSGVSSSFTDLATFTAEAFVATKGAPNMHNVRVEIRRDGMVAMADSVPLPFPYINYVPMPSQLRSRYQYTSLADIAKLRNAGYDTPFTPLKDAVHAYVGELAKESVT